MMFLGLTFPRALKSLTLSDSVSSDIVMQIHLMIQCDICETWYTDTTVLDVCRTKTMLTAEGLAIKFTFFFCDDSLGGAIFLTLIVLCLLTKGNLTKPPP